MPLYSEEIQDIMGRIPGRILRVGLTVIFSTFVLLLLGCYFFKCPVIVSCPVTLTTINPPQELYARSTGVIDCLNVTEQQEVSAGELIAILKNSANYQHAGYLERLLKQFDGILQWDTVVLQQKLVSALMLGEMQAEYMRFYKAWENFRTYLKQGYLPIKIDIQKKQVHKKQVDYKEQYRQLDLQRYDFEIAYRQFQRDSLFFHRFKDAVSMVEYEKQTQEYLHKKFSYIDFCSSIRDSENEILKQKEQLVDLEIQYVKELSIYRQDLDEAYRLLYESYYQWKEKYVLTSDIHGLVTFTGYWSKNQMVNMGERIATIVPQEPTKIVGRAIIDMTGIGKVEKMQKVNIKLTGYPFMQFGLLKGVISNVSLVPEKEKGYIAEIVLTEGMKSTYEEQLNFVQQIEGVADIITKEERLLTKLINPLRKFSAY